MKLFVTDLDGTLLAADQSVHPRDRAALARARAAGVLVTIATGRLTGRTHPIARELGFELPLVCADGSVLACGATQRVLRRHALPAPFLEASLDSFARHGVPGFVFTDDRIHACERGRAYQAYLSGWSEQVVICAQLGAAPCDLGHIVALLAIGPDASIDACERDLRDQHSSADISSFAGAGGRVLRAVARGASKGAALAELARELGVEPARVAVAGDFWNDLSMFAFAGRSFAMPHAPAEVRAAATHALDHDIARHGAFADALEAWLEER